MKSLKSTTCLTALLAAVAMSAAASAQEGPAGIDEIEDQIVVRGTFVPDEKRSTAEIASVLDAEDFARAGDSDVASAIRRVAGLSVVDGKFPVARGLNERYQSATVNGVPLPSPEPLRRAVPLDIIPTRILAGSLSQKTFSPEFSAEFGGAAIDLRTAAVPTENFLVVSGSAQYDSVSSLEDGLFYDGSDTDVFGWDDGLRDLPALAEQEVVSGARVLSPQAAAAFNNDETLVITREETPINGKGSLTVGGVLDRSAFSLGNVTYLGYSDEFLTREGEQNRSFLNAGVFSENDVKEADYFETRQEVELNAFSSTGLELAGGDHTLQSTSFLLRNTMKRAQTSDFIDTSELGDGQYRGEFTEFVERQVWQTQLSGEHLFAGLGDLEADWRVAYGEASRDAPYQWNTIRQLTTYGAVNPGIDPSEEQDIYAYSLNLSRNFVRFSELEDSNFYSGLDFTLPIDLASMAIELKAGGAYTDNTRETSVREFRIQLGDAVSTLGPLAAARTDILYSDEVFEAQILEMLSASGGQFPDQTEASLEVAAAYALADVELNEYLRFSLGGRWEDSTQETTTFLSSVGPTAEGTVALEEDYFLPAATVTWNPVGNLQLRGAYSKTITRPQFRELAGTEFLDPNLDVPLLGNPFLVNSEITNYDIRGEWYFARGEFLTLGLFYKDIENPIERVATTRESDVTTFVNSPSAEVMGAEFEFEKRFDLSSYGELMQDYELVFVSNYTYTDSEVGTDGTVIRPVQSDGTIRPNEQDAAALLVDGHSLEGQSDHLANLQLGVENVATGTTLTALVNYASDRTLLIGTADQEDADRVIEDVPVLLDLVFSKDFSLRGAEMNLGLKVQNILGEEFRAYREDTTGEQQSFIDYDRGRLFTVSLSAEF